VQHNSSASVCNHVTTEKVDALVGSSAQERLPVVRLPNQYGPATTIYNRFVRWAERGIWENLFGKLAGSRRLTDTQMVNSTHVKAHRTRRLMYLQMLKPIAILLTGGEDA
jgi:transposase